MPPAAGPRVKAWKNCSIFKVLKGVFGLADARRMWYLCLKKEMEGDGWKTSFLDGAFWLKFSEEGELIGLCVGHVDDLLMAGNDEARRSLDRIGEPLGFGKVSLGDFVWCGKRIQRCPKTRFINISMTEYHENFVDRLCLQRKTQRSQQPAFQV